MPNLFGPALREARKGAGMTIDRLSSELNFSKTYLSDVERGLRPPLRGDKIMRAARACNVEAETLIAPAARDRGCVDIPVTDEMSDEVLLALVHMRVKISESGKTGLSTLRKLVVRRR